MTERSGQPQFHGQTPDWRRHRRLLRDGFRDLEYLPRARAGWNGTLAAHAYSVRRLLAGRADMGVWAVMHGCQVSARYRELGDSALVLWHGTSTERAARVREVGLFHKRGVWATLEPKIAHGYSRGRARQNVTGSATVVLLLDRREAAPGRDYELETPEVLRFHHDLPPEWVEYILWDDRVEFVGAVRSRDEKPWAVAPFKKKDGRWVPRSQPPVRFDNEQTYADLEGWLRLSIRRIIDTLGSASAVEIFSSLYATISPWEALEHADIFRALEDLCPPPRRRRGIKVFSAQAPDAAPSR